MPSCLASSPRAGLTARGAWALLVLAAFGASRAVAQGTEVTSADVKAVFIHHFLESFEWPEQAVKDRFVVGVFGDPVLTESLRDVAAARPGSRTVVVRSGPSLSALEDVHVLFFASSEEASLEESLAKVGGRPVLTVSDSAGWCRRGVMVNFVGSQRRITFELNPSAVARANLVPSAQLLELARIVDDGGRDVGNGAARGGYVVIVNANNSFSADPAVMKERVRSLFLGLSPAWPHEVPGEPLGRPSGSPAEVAFAHHVLGMTVDELRSHWAGGPDAHGGAAPAVVASSKTLLRRVAKGEGAVGFLAASETATLPARVRVLFRFGEP